MTATIGTNVRVLRPDKPPEIVTTRREHVQAVLARCYVKIAEVDFDLRAWQQELTS